MIYAVDVTLLKHAAYYLKTCNKQFIVLQYTAFNDSIDNLYELLPSFYEMRQKDEMIQLAYNNGILNMPRRLSKLIELAYLHSLNFDVLLVVDFANYDLSNELLFKLIDDIYGIPIYKIDSAEDFHLFNDNLTGDFSYNGIYNFGSHKTIYESINGKGSLVNVELKYNIISQGSLY